MSVGRWSVNGYPFDCEAVAVRGRFKGGRWGGGRTQCSYYIFLKKMCPLTMYLSSYFYVSSYYYFCVLILLNVCPHTTVFKSGRWVGESRGEMERKFNRSSYSYICVLILVQTRPHTTMCPHATTKVSSYYYMCPHTTTCVLILLFLCPHTAIYVQQMGGGTVSCAGCRSPGPQARL